jgi:putative ABC transport system substrate-binding protein
VTRGTAEVTRRVFARRVTVLLAGTVVTLVWRPDLAAAQSIPRIGVLVFRPRAASPFPEAFPGALRELGYVEGRTIQVEYRYAEGREDRAGAMAAELVLLKPDVIVGIDTPAVRALKNATTTIPIVMAAGDPVGTGLVASLARPGGNITGVSGTNAELVGKTLQHFREMVPRAAKLGLLTHRTDPFTRSFVEQSRQAAGKLGIEVHQTVVDGPAQAEASFASVVNAGVDGLLVQPILATKELAAAAIKHRIPAIAVSPAFVHAGGLLSYAPDYTAFYGRLAGYVDKILKGARPGDLPIEQPTKFQLVVNLRTAKALNLTVPQSVRLQADRLVN